MSRRRFQLSGVDERMKYVIKHLPKNRPLPWCIFGIVPGYEKEFKELCTMPADHVYLAGFTDKIKAESYLNKLERIIANS